MAPPQIEQFDLSALPTLGRTGFNDQPAYWQLQGRDLEIAVDEILTARQFLAEYVIRSESRAVNSYVLKHIIERNVDRYISNGSCIAAALDLGHRVVRYRSRSSPNAAIYVVPTHELRLLDAMRLRQDHA